MKVEDFEKAIDALEGKTMIDEMKIRKNQVYLCTGYVDNYYVQWDELGKAVGWELADDEDAQNPMVRMTMFDLKFE